MHDKICGYYLDKQQTEIVIDDSKHLLVVAGAGSGKTLTILGKIYYLIKYKNILPQEILCISFTNAASQNLKAKIEKELFVKVPVYTFHKLSLELLKNDFKNYEVASDDTLMNVIHKFFFEDILENNKLMKMVLRYFKVSYIFGIKKSYINFIKYNKETLERFEHLLSTFIKLFKCNNHNVQSFREFLKTSNKLFNFNRKVENAFLLLALNIYLIYQKYLIDNCEIDFDDMLIKATEYVKITKNVYPYKYVIIDEYQDTSFIRFNLIRKILDVTNANLMVVGDDFQSIYRFTGCDISLFLNFDKYFSDTKILKIENTYRNSQELVNIVGRFVLKNKHQIKKQLSSVKHLDNPVCIVYYKDIKEAFLKLIEKIHNETQKPILVIGRNNKDVYLLTCDKVKYKNGVLEIEKNPNIAINYMTAHKSKGLEEENVIIINLSNAILGFPNKIKNDKILRFVSSNYEKYMYAEERRLFYVALTRTKNKVYLLVPLENKSIFIKELIKDNYRNLDIIKL